MRPEKGPQKTKVRGVSVACSRRRPALWLTLRVFGSGLLNTPSSLLGYHAEVVIATRVSRLQAIEMLEHVKLQRANVASMRERVATRWGRVGFVLVVTSRQTLRLGKETRQAEQAGLLPSDRPGEGQRVTVDEGRTDEQMAVSLNVIRCEFEYDLLG